MNQDDFVNGRAEWKKAGYWSQNSTLQVLGYSGNPAAVEVTWSDGTKESVEISAVDREYIIHYRN